MKRLTLSILTSALASAAMAQDSALVIGNMDYRTLGEASGLEATQNTGDALAAFGFQVMRFSDALQPNLAANAQSFAANVDGEGIAIAVLSGRFVHGGQDTWFLGTEAAADNSFAIGAEGLSVQAVLDVLGRAQGTALLVLAEAGGTETDAPRLSSGIGALDVPQGVTVVSGSQAAAHRFLQQDLSVAGADLSKSLQGANDLTVQGFLPRSWVLIPVSLAGAGVADPEADPRDAADWAKAMEADSRESYQAYLDAWPEGEHAQDAERKLAEIAADPFYENRKTEEALNLTREQRQELQRDLTILDFNTRGIDGIFGPGTRQAITNWQQENGFPQSSYLDEEQIVQLDAQAARRSAELEAEAQARREAEERADRAFWEETGAVGDEVGYRAYLERYPDGVFSETARERLARIEEDKRAEAEAEEIAAWDVAVNNGSVAAFENYLTLYPHGMFVQEANAKISELTSATAPDAVEISQFEAIEQALPLNQANRALIEQRLSQLGYDPGPQDGVFDEATRKAIRNYQRSLQLTPTGYLDQNTLVTLMSGLTIKLR